MATDGEEDGEFGVWWKAVRVGAGVQWQGRRRKTLTQIQKPQEAAAGSSRSQKLGKNPRPGNKSGWRRPGI